ncbi:uncharacterized protein TRIADDRAFT_30505 [Trichoplax adhaerens]|uniref:Carnosine N-methyltransferase n=1 Tax=Trichoplax adhaerens TaxID=10228 RepID=B3S7S1_TRIAD|nr:hypothetical protein TRIADDRAFT_30505 [Trichoplax adhaerens]EDV21245.1 hypothetical protein TRIADDRAFT_30505 [Trichoplax adhaerens]|eukprot:XP_002116212.1 hypothetical protein TRIADDRAFT_30505 [Trichoplax adhaerens]
MEKDEMTQEMEHYQRIVRAFLYYRIHSLKRVNQARRCFTSLSKEDQQLAPKFTTKLDLIKMAIGVNYDFIRTILQRTQNLFLNSEIYQMDEVISSVYIKLTYLISTVPEFDMEKVKSTIKQFVRDWSKEGEKERNTCYLPIINEILRLFPRDDIQPNAINILVPGAGLGRLAFEIVKLGYNCQGNEISLYMLITSNFILNNCTTTEQYVIYPWVHQYCNIAGFDDQVRNIKIPDMAPSEIPKDTSFSMCAGDFLLVYNDPGKKWDCVATCFFIDTAHSIIAYIKKIYQILKPGGYWINLGPLLYHFADMAGEQSLELSYEEVKTVIENVGFSYEKEEKGIVSGYTQDPSSLMTTLYHNIFFIVRKPEIDQQQ